MTTGKDKVSNLKASKATTRRPYKKRKSKDEYVLSSIYCSSSVLILFVIVYFVVLWLIAKSLFVFLLLFLLSL